MDMMEVWHGAAMAQPHPVTLSGGLVHFQTDMDGLMQIAGSGNIHSTGYNVWDEQTQVGRLEQDGSINTAITNRLVTSLIDVTPGEKYCFYQGIYTNRGRAAFYNSNGGLLSYLSDFPANADDYIRYGNAVYTIFTVPTNAIHMRVCLNSAYGVTYNKNISVNHPHTSIAYYPYSGIVGTQGNRKQINGINNVWSNSGSVTVTYWTH